LYFTPVSGFNQGFMGAFFVNYHVRSDSMARVRDALSPMVKSAAYVSPSKAGWVTVYEKSSDQQDDQIIRRIANELSTALKTAIVSFLVHDSDIFMYWLFQSGQLVDEFNSAPDYFKRAGKAEHARVRGNSDALLPLCVPGTTRDQVEAVLHPPEGQPLFAEDIVSDLAGLLGIDEARASLGFNYFDEEAEQNLPDAAEFEPVGKGAERKASGAEHGAEASPPSAFPIDQAHLSGAAPNPLAFAISMLAHGWDVHKQFVRFTPLPGVDVKVLRKQLDATFARTVAAVLKRVAAPGIPSLDELKAARDQGPDALAELVAKQLPDLLVEIGVGAASMQSPTFLEALLKQGLDPNIKDARGISAIQAAGVHGPHSEVCLVIKRFGPGKT
jgi:hypothetical protein